jgi:hypothetical protein
MLGFSLSREEPNSHPNLGRHDSTVSSGMDGHVMCPGTLNP